MDHLDACLDLVFARNPAARVVVAADTLDALTRALEGFQRLGLTDVDVAQIALTQTPGLGKTSRMTAQDPVWVGSGEGENCEIE